MYMQDEQEVLTKKGFSLLFYTNWATVILIHSLLLRSLLRLNSCGGTRLRRVILVGFHKRRFASLLKADLVYSLPLLQFLRYLHVRPGCERERQKLRKHHNLIVQLFYLHSLMPSTKPFFFMGSASCLCVTIFSILKNCRTFGIFRKPTWPSEIKLLHAQ